MKIVPLTAVLGIASAAADTTLEDALRERWTTAYNGGDAAALGGVYAEDARLQNGHCPTVIGRGAIEAFWRGDLGDGSPQTRLSVADSFALEDLVYLSGSYAVLIEGAPPHVGTYLQIWRREGSAAAWTIHRETWINQACAERSSDSKPPGAEPSPPVDIEL